MPTHRFAISNFRSSSVYLVKLLPCTRNSAGSILDAINLFIFIKILYHSICNKIYLNYTFNKYLIIIFDEYTEKNLVQMLPLAVELLRLSEEGVSNYPFFGEQLTYVEGTQRSFRQGVQLHRIVRQMQKQALRSIYK